MKAAFQGDNVDYSSFFSQSLDPLAWNLNHDSSNMNVESTSVSPSISPPSSAVPSPSATTSSPVALQEVSLQIPAALQVGPMSPPVPSLPLSAFAALEDFPKATPYARKRMTSSHSKAGYRAPIVKPSPAEEELVRRIHRKVGGPSKLSTYDDPTKVRHVVIEALANEQGDPTEASRVRKGQLTVFERRVVRTVTNRGAAVRSRMRQRKEMANLKDELEREKAKVLNLETVVRSVVALYAIPIRPIPPTVAHQIDEALQAVPRGPNDSAPAMTSNSINDTVEGIFSKREPMEATGRDMANMGMGPTTTNDLGLHQPSYSCLTDTGITHTPWS